AARRCRAVARAPLALVADLDPTLRIAPVSVVAVAVVAAFVRIDRTVTAQVNARTRLPRRSAGEPLLDEATARGAAVAVLLVPVVTGLARTDDPVPADDGRDTGLARRRTLPERLDDAPARAAVARQTVPIVALFRRVEIDEPVPTRRILRHQPAFRFVRIQLARVGRRSRRIHERRSARVPCGRRRLRRVAGTGSASRPRVVRSVGNAPFGQRAARPTSKQPAGRNHERKERADAHVGPRAVTFGAGLRTRRAILTERHRLSISD